MDTNPSEILVCADCVEEIQKPQACKLSKHQGKETEFKVFKTFARNEWTSEAKSPMMSECSESESSENDYEEEDESSSSSGESQN